MLGGLLYLLSSEGRHRDAATEGEQALALARSVGDLGLEAWARAGLGRAYFALGQYRLGIERTRWVAHGEAAATLDTGARQGGLLPSVACRRWLALCLASIGEFDPALRVAEDAVRGADAAASPLDQVWASYSLARVHLERGDPATAIPLLEGTLPFCEQGETQLYYPRVLDSLGAAYALVGRSGEAVKLLDQAVAESRAIRLAFGHATIVIHFADACLRAGRIGEATALADEALALARQHGERGDEACALHVLGEIASRRSPFDRPAPEAAYREALAIARELGMLPLEARCHLGLGEALDRAGQSAEAQGHLARARDLSAALGLGPGRREA